MIFPTYVCVKNLWIFFLSNVFLVNINKNQPKKIFCKFLKGFWNSRNIYQYEIEKIRRWKKISQKTTVDGSKSHSQPPGMYKTL